MTKENNTLAEVFPVQVDNLPHMEAYSLSLRGGEASKVGRKLAYRFGKKLGGHWIWADYRIVTDRPTPQSEIDSVLQDAWSSQPDVYRHLEGLHDDPNWTPSVNALAAVAAYGIARDHDHAIKRMLAEERVHLDPAYIDRVHEIRPWVIGGNPSLSVSVSSRLVHKQDVNEYASSISDTSRLVGLWVADKNSTFKGKVVEVIGDLDEHRDRLVGLTQNEDTLESIRESPDNTAVLRVGREQYDYAATCLRIIMRMDYMHEFGVDRSKAQRILRISPSDRWKIVSKISGLLRMNGLIGFEYNSHKNPEVFLSRSDLGVDRRVRLGNDTIVPYGKDIFYQIKRNGLYRISEEFLDGTPIKIGIIKSRKTRPLKGFYQTLQNEIKTLDLCTDMIGEQLVSEQSRIELEKAVDSLMEKEADIVLGIFSESPGYYIFKSLTVGRGLASQVVLDRTLNKEYAVPNIVLGITGKTGNIPYVLATPLPYADVVVGIDIARKTKKQLEGSVNIAAIARIYFSDGQFVKYVIHDEPIEGETLPKEVLESMFPASEFRGKRVVIHRDGWWRGQERSVLLNWAKDIGAEFYPVEIVKSGAPRIYSFNDFGPPPTEIDQARKGTSFRISSSEAILVSTPPPFRGATAQPLRVRSGSTLSINQALHSVLSLTYLHYGSTLAPRLPVTVHYSDQIAGLALEGVKPKNLIGTRPYWL